MPSVPRSDHVLSLTRDEVEVPVDVCTVGRYVCVKFLQPRHSSAERLGIVGIKFYGFHRKGLYTVHRVTNSCPRMPVRVEL